MMTLKEVKANSYVSEFINQTDKALCVLEYTEHGFPHADLVAGRAKRIAYQMGLPKNEQELAAIAGFCHDMGNFLSRAYHHYLSALMFMNLFR